MQCRPLRCWLFIFLAADLPARALLAVALAMARVHVRRLLVRTYSLSILPLKTELSSMGSGRVPCAQGVVPCF